MPHLSPMNWMMMLMFSTLLIMMMNSMSWWSTSMKMKQMSNKISSNKLISWKW